MDDASGTPFDEGVSRQSRIHGYFETRCWIPSDLAEQRQHRLYSNDFASRRARRVCLLVKEKGVDVFSVGVVDSCNMGEVVSAHSHTQNRHSVSDNHWTPITTFEFPGS